MLSAHFIVSGEFTWQEKVKIKLDIISGLGVLEWEKDSCTKRGAGQVVMLGLCSLGSAAKMCVTFILQHLMQVESSALISAVDGLFVFYMFEFTRTLS